MSRISTGMRDFQRLVLQCQLTDMAYQGPKYTWCNKREDGIICKKLDRVLLNEEALHRFSNAYSIFEPGGCSDHMRCCSVVSSRRKDQEAIQVHQCNWKYT